MGAMLLNSPEIEDIEWTVDLEVQLLFSMIGHKPVGPAKHFHMICILKKFSNSINKNVSSKAIWKKLETMYDMAALDESETLNLPQREFSLPRSTFAELMNNVEEVSADDSNDGEDIKKYPLCDESDEETKNDSTKNTVKKESKEPEKEMTKDVKKEGLLKKESSKDSIKKVTKDTVMKKEVTFVKDSKKDEKKDALKKEKKFKTADKKILEQIKKDYDIKRLETNKKGESLKVNDVPKHLRVEALKREALGSEKKSDKKKDVDKNIEPSKSTETSPEQMKMTPKLRHIKDKKETNKTEKDMPPSGVKRERSRNSESPTNEETPKRSVKGRPTRNSMDPFQQPKSASPLSGGPQAKRRRIV